MRAKFPPDAKFPRSCRRAARNRRAASPSTPGAAAISPSLRRIRR